MNITIVFLILLTFLSRIIGLVREITLAYFYGASMVSDAYLMSIAIPTIIVTFVVVSLATSFIPVYQKIEDKPESQTAFTNEVLGLTSIVCLLILVASWSFAPQIVRLFVSGLDEATTALTITLLRTMLFAVFFMGANHILHSFLQVKEKVLLASLSGLPFNLFSVLFIAISARTSTHFLAVGTVLALGAQCLYLLVLAYRQGFKWQWRLNVKDKTIQHLVVLTLPIVLANTVEQIGILIDKSLASQFGTGAISSLSYATRTTTAISGIFVTSFLVVSFPKIANQAANQNMKEMKNSLAESIVGMSLFIVPATVAVATFAHPVIALLFGRGAFDDAAIAQTSSLLLFYVFFLLGNGLSQLLTRVFFSLGDSKTPMIVASLTVGFNVALNILLTSLMGISGLALATSIAAFGGLLLHLFLLRQKIGNLKLKETGFSLGKIVVASLLMSFGAHLVHQALVRAHEIVALLAAAAIGIGIYGILLLLFRIKEVQSLVAFLLEKIKKHFQKNNTA